MDAIICEFLDTFENDKAGVEESVSGQCQNDERDESADAITCIQFLDEIQSSQVEEGAVRDMDKVIDETEEGCDSGVFTTQSLEEPSTEYAQGRHLACHC